jgi:hypothetical protein
MNRRGFMGVLGSAAVLPSLSVSAIALNAPKVHQPYVLERGGTPFEIGDLVRCENGCDYAEIVGVNLFGWPEMKPLGENKCPLGASIPVKCKCGGVAIRWAEPATEKD